jgi:K+-sensing histidine kinase KdpD
MKNDKVDIKKLLIKKRTEIIITAGYLIVYPLIIYIFIKAFQFPSLTIESSTLLIALMIIPLIVNSFFYEIEGALIVSFVIVELSFLLFVFLRGSFPSWSTGEKITIIFSFISYILMGVVIGQYNRKKRIQEERVRQLTDKVAVVREGMIDQLKERVKELEEKLKEEKRKRRKKVK